MRNATQHSQYPAGPAASGGFTLAELLIVTAIAVLLATLALPMLAQLVQDARLLSYNNRLLHLAWLARQEAAKRGREAVLCPSRDGQLCGPVDEPDQGWLLFIRSTGSQTQPAGADAILIYLPIAAGLRTSANRPGFVLRPWGQNATNGTILVCDQRGTGHARALIISTTGRPRTAPAIRGSSTCPPD